MGKTSSKVKDRYNAKAYDQVIVRLPKGLKERLQEACAANEESLNSVFVAAAKAYLGDDEGPA